MDYKKKDGSYECKAQPSYIYAEKSNITWHYLCLLLFMPWASIVLHMHVHARAAALTACLHLCMGKLNFSSFVAALILKSLGNLFTTVIAHCYTCTLP